MNFLAHCTLAHPETALVAGGFIGDFVKGPVPDVLPEPLQAGIRLHRRVDAVSNRLPGVTASVRRLDPKLRRAAPVLLDVVADHCLALRWDRHGHGDLTTFAALAYDAIGEFEQFLPEQGRRYFRRFRDADVLARYGEPCTALRAMNHILERLRLAHLAPELDAIVGTQLPHLMDDFEEYFPELRAVVVAWKREHPYACRR